MESPSFIHTGEEQQRLLTPHEYTGESISLRYQDRISCHRRTEFTCVNVGIVIAVIGRERTGRRNSA